MHIALAFATVALPLRRLCGNGAELLPRRGTTRQQKPTTPLRRERRTPRRT